MKRNNRAKGNFYEEKAVNFLLEQGCVILERNYRCSKGEIDIIASQGEKILFIEVKYRRSLKYGEGLEAVDRKKITRIYRSAEYYLYEKGYLDNEIRFDCISFLGEKISWIKNLVWGDEIGF